MNAAVQQLLALQYPAEFTLGAYSAVSTYLSIQPDEKVTPIAGRTAEQIMSEGKFLIDA